jgi:group I intron endonuclease
MNKIIGIYQIISPSNKIYIGQSWNILKRKYCYKNLHCQNQHKLFSSLKSHGWSKHRFYIIDTFESTVTQDTLNEKEIYWINFYRKMGYKLLNIKEGGSNGKLAKETRLKISIKGKGRIVSEFTKEKLRIANLGKKHTSQSKDKMSKSKKGKKASPITIKKLSKSVIQLDLKDNLIKVWPSMRNAADENSLDYRQISSVCRNQKNHNTAGGFKWKYFLE